MRRRIFLSSDDLAVIECPRCRKTKLTDVSRFKRVGRKVNLKARCPCGHVFTVALERRRHYRKVSNFPGIFKVTTPGKTPVSGTMTVRDLSLLGVKLKLNVPPAIEKGDKLLVEFHLDDARRSLIKKEVIVRSIAESVVGVEFCPDPHAGEADRQLGFYFLT